MDGAKFSFDGNKIRRIEIYCSDEQLLVLREEIHSIIDRFMEARPKADVKPQIVFTTESLLKLPPEITLNIKSTKTGTGAANCA